MNVRIFVKVRMFAVPAAIALIALGAGACGQSHPAAQPADTHTPTAQPSPSAPSSAPVLSPGESATFSLGESFSSQVSKMTWTMGSHVATVPDSLKAGYQDIAFNMTVRNDGAEEIKGGGGGAQSDMVWHGTDGRTDNTLAHTAATDIYPSEHGLTGQDLALLTGIPANGYAAGWISLLVPTSPGAVVIVDPNTSKPVLLINYDKLTSDQLKGLHVG